MQKKKAQPNPQTKKSFAAKEQAAHQQRQERLSTQYNKNRKVKPDYQRMAKMQAKNGNYQGREKVANKTMQHIPKEKMQQLKQQQVVIKKYAPKTNIQQRAPRASVRTR